MGAHLVEPQWPGWVACGWGVGRVVGMGCLGLPPRGRVRVHLEGWVVEWGGGSLPVGGPPKWRGAVGRRGGPGEGVAWVGGCMGHWTAGALRFRGVQPFRLLFLRQPRGPCTAPCVHRCEVVHKHPTSACPALACAGVWWLCVVSVGWMGGEGGGGRGSSPAASRSPSRDAGMCAMGSKYGSHLAGSYMALRKSRSKVWPR